MKRLVALGTLGLIVVGVLVRPWWSGEGDINVQDALPGGVLRVGIDSGYAPFVMDERGELQGIDIEIGRGLGELLAIEVDFVPIGYDGLYDALMTGRVDAIISALVVDERRANEVRYTIGYFDNGLVVVRDDDWTGHGVLWDGQRIAFEYGSHADGEVRQVVRRAQDVHLLPYEKPQYALDAVRLGEADMAVVDATTLYLYLNDHRDWRIDMAFITHVDYAIAVRADRETTFHSLQWALIRLLEEGELDAIVDGWLHRPYAGEGG